MLPQVLLHGMQHFVIQIQCVQILLICRRDRINFAFITCILPFVPFTKAFFRLSIATVLDHPNYEASFFGKA